MLVSFLHLRGDVTQGTEHHSEPSLPCRFISGDVRVLGCMPEVGQSEFWLVRGSGGLCDCEFSLPKSIADRKIG